MEFNEALKVWNGGIMRGAASRLARALKVSKPMVTDWTKYGKRPGEEMAGRIGRVLGISAAEVLALFSGKSAPPAGVDMSTLLRDVPLVPVRGIVSADRFSVVFDAVPEEMIPNPYPNKKDAFALRIKGDCMEPALHDGEFVYVLPTEPAADKKIVLARLDGEYTLKRYRILGGVPWLVPDNKKYDRIKVTSKVIICGVVDQAVTVRRNL